MSVVKRGQVWYLRLWLFEKGINLRSSARSKTEAQQIERALLAACKSQDFRSLTAIERETCVRLYENQGWEIPEDLRPNAKPVPKDELTLSRTISIFLGYPSIKGTPKTERYIQSFAHYLRKGGEDKLVKSIWVPDIRLYQTERLEEGATPSTINKKRGALSKLFGVLQNLQFVQTNPCRLVTAPSEKSGERQVYLSLEDFNRIVALVPASFCPVAQTAYYTGMRRGEIVGLTRKQVDLKNRLIYPGPQDTKEGHWKRVPIHKDLFPILEEIL